MEGLEKAIEQIKENMPKLDLRENEPMRNHCSFKVGGAVRAFAVPGDLFEMSKVMFYLHMNGVSPLTLGKCTNVIFPEEGLDIMVISTENLRKLRLGETENTIYAEAGVSLAKLAQFARDNGLSGLEFASGIPGSVGRRRSDECRSLRWRDEGCCRIRRRVLRSDAGADRGQRLRLRL